MIELSVSSA